MMDKEYIKKFYDFVMYMTGPKLGGSFILMWIEGEWNVIGEDRVVLNNDLTELFPFIDITFDDRVEEVEMFQSLQYVNIVDIRLQYTNQLVRNFDNLEKYIRIVEDETDDVS